MMVEPRHPNPDLDESARDYLKQFPARRTGPLANDFHNAVRAGCRSPLEILVVVSLKHKTQLGSRWATEEDRAFHRQVLETIHGEDRQPAVRYAAYVIAYEALTYPERQRLKDRRAAPYRKQGMEGKPVTDAQRRLLFDLGATEEPADRKEASELIDALLSERRGGVK
jgi:hypothetical protein